MSVNRRGYGAGPLHAWPAARWVTLVPALGVALMCAACHQIGDLDPAVDGERPTQRLSAPTDEFPTPFGSIRAVLAIPDGRLVVSDPQEARIVLVDFERRTHEPLSRHGEGPREFRRPGGLYRGPGGGVLVFDQALIRLLPVLPTGELEDAVALPAGGIAGSWSARGPDPLAFDSLGHTYLDQGKGRLFDPTSVILRYRPGNRPDTLAALRAKEIKALQVKGNGLGTYQEVLFSPEDAWAVTPDGWVAIVRAEPYRIEWISPVGVIVPGASVHHQTIAIPRAEKEAIASGSAGWRGTSTVQLVRVSPGGPPPAGSTQPSPVPVGDLLFADHKTPVNLRDGRWPVFDERGRLWVERSLPYGAAGRVFDVFDRAGKLVGRVELPAQSRLVAVGQEWIYAARRDADDLEYLQRYPLPR